MFPSMIKLHLVIKILKLLKKKLKNPNGGKLKIKKKILCIRKK
jgi:hypothetical protein